MVIFHPNAKDENVAYKRSKEPNPWLSLAIIVAKAAKLAIVKGLFKYLFIGKSNVNLIAASLIKAAIDPVKVIPPIRVPRKAAILPNVVGSWIQNEPREVVTAARPTSAWKAATVWGS